MLTDLQLAVVRYEVYARDVIRPAIYGATARLQASVHQGGGTREEVAHPATPFQPVEPGWRWGPVWSTAWFRLRGTVPMDMYGKTVAVRFSSGTEALLWQGDAARRGFDRNRDACVLFDPAAGGEPVDLLIEAACNHPFGATAFWWDPPDVAERWSSSTPGILERAELAVWHEGVWRLWVAFDLAWRLLKELAEDTARARALDDALRDAVRVIDDTDVAGTAAAAAELVEHALVTGTGNATTCHAVGHAHIDTAWLWPIRETRRKCLRTFSNVLELMDRFPDFRFLCSQPQQYAWVEADAPGLFDRIVARIRDGRWEASGAMWIEPDCNVPSGESLVRQLVHGVRYFEDRLGSPQRLLYLPDTFGFPASLPQIMAGAGIDTFITNKMSWSQHDDFPHVTFQWRGLDGTEVLSHFTPGHDYNATNSAIELRRGDRNAARLDAVQPSVWLQPFGFGDGGGGPTDDQVRRAELAASCEGLPNVRFSDARAFCTQLHERAEEHDLPVWDGELYLELHRGTYTTQSWLKQANRRAECGLRAAEWLLAGEGPLPELDEAWKRLLLNQFHDILPGSSIPAVYEDARRDHDRIARTVNGLIERGAAAWSPLADTTGIDRPMLVLNGGSAEASGLVTCEGELHYVASVPALGAAIVDRDAAPDVGLVGIEDGTLYNGIVEAGIDALGRVETLRHVATGREACAEPMNALAMYEDRPRSWEAWDIDREYVEKPVPLGDAPDRWEVVEASPLRAVIEVSRPLGTSSRITQRFVLEAGSPRLDVRTHVDWRERRRLLRVLFPVAVRSRRATYEIQFGHVERPTHANTSWERAQFEVCAHTWMDLSEPGFGLALLNDGKYGHSCRDGVCGLTLLRGAEFPDPEADLGEHEFTYSLMPHGGDWRAAGVDREAERLNTPLIARPLPAGQAGPVQESWSSFAMETYGAAGVTVAAVKAAEDGDGVIVRLVETHGGRGAVTLEWPVGVVEPVDLLERPVELDGFAHEEQRTVVPLGPFQIVTLRAR